MTKICLDAGHYGKYNQSPANKAYYEAEMNWKLHNLLKKYLKQKGFEVIQTRSNQATDLALTSRGRLARGCDLFLSIHSNAVGSGVNETIDYPVAYVSISGKADDIGLKLARCVESVMDTDQKARIEHKKGSNGDYYGVLRGAAAAGVPGVILEHSFHTNTRMTNWLLDDGNLDKLAKAEADVIADYFGVKKQTGNAGADLLRVQVGAYSVEKNADNQLAKVKAAGFTDAFKVKVGGLWKIQVGAYSVRANAEKQLAKLKKAGFDAFITQ